MAKVNVIIVDATGNKEQKVGLPDDVKIGILNFKNGESAKTEYTHWKNARNTCVHGKAGTIDSSTVEAYEDLKDLCDDLN